MIESKVIYKMLSIPETVRVPRNDESDKVYLRLRFKQENVETGEITIGDYGTRNFEVLKSKSISNTFTVYKRKLQNNFWEIIIT